MSRSKKNIFHVNLLRKWLNPAELSYFMTEVIEEDDELEEQREREKDVNVPILRDNLTKTEKEEFRRLLNEFLEVFSRSCGRTVITHHHINITRGQPIRQAPYRIPHACTESVEQQLKQMLDRGIIEPSQSEWAWCWYPKKMAPYEYVLTIGN
jgi:hypothetical protein